MNDGDQKNDKNIILRTDLEFDKHIKIVDQNTWKFLVERYGGGPEIKKPYYEEKKFDKKQVDYVSMKVIYKLN